MVALKRILVTGDKGYIGSVLTAMLLERGYAVTGLDTRYYSDCLLGDEGPSYPSVKRDIRDVTADDLEGVEAIIHLAALSNDPLGELSPGLTEEINLAATIRLASVARDAGVSRFVYSSSQSMYGISSTDAELDEDESPKNAITAYARTKWEAELALKRCAADDFVVVCFRPSTVFGASPRLRCDVVFNNLGLSGFPNPETLNMTRSCADEGLIGQPRLEEYGPCIARRRRGVVSDQARLRTGVDP